MTHEATKTSTRRVRFADSVGRELVTIFLVDLLSNFYSCSFHSSKNPFHHRAIEAAKKSLSLPTPPPNISQHHQTHHSFSFRYSPSLNNNSSNNNSNNNNNHSTSNSNNQQSSGHTIKESQSIYQLSNKSHHHHYQIITQQANRNFNHLNNASSSSSFSEAQPKQAADQRQSFVCDFTQPISLISFKERVRLNKVHLETCQISDLRPQEQQQVLDRDLQSTIATTTATTSVPLSQPIISISCTVRVLNLSYEKSVTVRYTTDDWHTFTDCLATYRPGSCDGWSDKFVATFTIHSNQQLPIQIQIQRIKFCVKFVSKQEVFWDNNGGMNYLVKRVS